MCHGNSPPKHLYGSYVPVGNHLPSQLSNCDRCPNDDFIIPNNWDEFVGEVHLLKQIVLSFEQHKLPLVQGCHASLLAIPQQCSSATPGFNLANFRILANQG